jgi:hypothetical protein
MSNINNYPLTATQINDEDFYDVDYWNGSAFESRKISGASLISILGGASTNIYNTDGTLTSNRLLQGDGNYTLEMSKIITFLFQSIPNASGQVPFTFSCFSTLLLEGEKLFIIRDQNPSVLLDVFTIDNLGRITINESYSLPIADGTVNQFLTTNGAGQSYWANINESFLGNNFSSTQWGASASSVPLLDGQIANGFTFFVPADKDTDGTTSWDEYTLAFGIDLTFTGTSGTAGVECVGFAFLATFNTDLDTTASDFVTLNKAGFLSLGVRLLYNGGATIRLCSTEANCNSLTIANVSGDLDGTRINPFTGVDAAAIDHVLIPYVGEPYEGQRLQHKMRVNFGIVTGNNQTLALSLRRFEDDTIIGSEQEVTRNNDVEGNQFNFLTYTSGPSDPFTTGGFYFALRNDSGVQVEINGNVGIYIETTYQKPTTFP